MSKKSWMWGVAAVLMILVCGALSACGSMAKPAPSNAKELYERYKASEASDNYHLVAKCVVGMSALDKKMDCTVVEEGDIAGKAGHAKATVQTTTEDAGNKNETELYIAEEDGSYVMYTKTTGSNRWMRQKQESIPLSDTSSFLGDGSKFEDAEFRKTDDGYEVTFSGMSTNGFSSQLSSLESLGEDVQKAVEDAFAKSSVTVSFDNDCMLRKLTTKADISLGGTRVGSVMSGMTFDLDVELSGYGSVDSASVAVPEDIKKAASGQGATTDLDALLGGGNQTEEERRAHALEEAESYLKSGGFSHDGLIKQLEFMRISTEDATYAADNCGADWNEEAVDKAKDKLEYGSYSRDGLIKQLVDMDGFTNEQATYGVDKCGADWGAQAEKRADELLEMGYSHDGLIRELEKCKFSQEDTKRAVEKCNADWNEQAVKRAEYLLKWHSYSRDGLAEKLEKEDGFTREQAKYGADNCGVNSKEQAVKKAQEYIDYYKERDYAPLSRVDLIALLKSDGFTEDEAASAADSVGL